MANSSHWTAFATPIGELTLFATPRGVRALYLERHRHRPPNDPTAVRDDAALAPVATQLREYLAGQRRSFDLELDLSTGTPFQQRVWSALRTIPYGETTSYGALAQALGAPGAARAVGLANGRNPISIIVPCHRVVGADGSLTGYGGGMQRKRWLLDLERGTRTLDHDLGLSA